MHQVVGSSLIHRAKGFSVLCKEGKKCKMHGMLEKLAEKERTGRKLHAFG